MRKGWAGVRGADLAGGAGEIVEIVETGRSAGASDGRAHVLDWQGGPGSPAHRGAADGERSPHGPAKFAGP